jgi:VWFA-related protein
MTRAVLTILLCALALPRLDAQSASAFRAESRLVRVDVSVQGAHGDIITDLAPAAFTVYENGKAQPISLFLQDDIPVSLGLVIDNSGSMRTRRAQVEAAALAFARASNPLDEVFVVNFADTPRLDVPFTNDVRVLEAGIARMDSIGGTALRDAVAMAVAYLADHATRDHKILLVMTDGGDNSSAISNDAVRERAERAGIALYAIGVPQPDASKATRGRHELDDLTERTGGAAFHPGTLDEVEPVAIRLAHQVRRRYTLAYVPLNQSLDGSYRKIRVVVKAPEQVSVHSRAGYYATPRR